MKSGKLLVAIIAICYFILRLWVGSPAIAGEEPDTTAEAAIVMDLHSGQVIWAKDENTARPPASTTKILTALIALEEGNLQDEVTISDAAVRVDGTRVYLVAGEKQSLENLLYAMLLNSANDAAYAIAEHIGGSIEGFAQKMNEKAKSLGARNSNFINPNGLADENHYTTALDLALISRAAMANPTFREIVATETKAWQGAEWTSTLINQNKLLSGYEGALGIKTGYTSKAKWCLVSAAERNGEAFLVVVLGDTKNGVWSDSKILLDYGFNNFYTQNLATKGQVVAQVEIEGQKLELATISDLTYLQSKNNPFHPEEIINVMALKAPIEQGDKVGEMEYLRNGQVLDKLDLVAKNKIKNRISLWEWWSGGATVVIGILILGFIIRLKNNNRTRGYRTFCSSKRYRFYKS